jgi:hypothetical protein
MICGGADLIPGRAVTAIRDIAQVDSELLAFFIEVASLEAEGPGRVRDIAMVAIQLGEHSGTFKRCHACGEWAGALRLRRCPGSRLSRGKGQANGFHLDLLIGQ